MKHGKLFILTVAIYLAATISPAMGQVKKNSFRIGGGINICLAEYMGRTVSVGPAMDAEYSRYVNGYFSAAANVHYALCSLDKISSGSRIGLSVRGVTRPLAFTQWGRWLEIGLGIMCNYTYVMYGDTGSLMPTGNGEEVIFWKISNDSSVNFGLDFPIRAYIINRDRFELFAFYDFKTVFRKDRIFALDHSVCGMMFGIKF